MNRQAGKKSSHDIVMEDSSHLWAISYADFLMVLLSFFAVFFSVDDKKRDQFIFQIAQEMKPNEAGKAAGTRKPDAQAEIEAAPPAPSLASALDLELRSSLGRAVQVEQNTESILIHFPDNIYGVGQVELNSEQQQALAVLLKKIRPHLDSVLIGFVGHADSIPVAQAKYKVLKTNLDISVVRASKALVLAAEMGIPIEKMYASGSGGNIRRSRSLSVVVKSAAGGRL